VFEKALGIAGGFGEALLNGLLPVALAYRYRQTAQNVQVGTEPLAGKRVLAALFAFGLFVMGLETAILIH
jgi:tyrosine-specific transport protein